MQIAQIAHILSQYGLRKWFLEVAIWQLFNVWEAWPIFSSFFSQIWLNLSYGQFSILRSDSKKKLIDYRVILFDIELKKSWVPNLYMALFTNYVHRIWAISPFPCKNAYIWGGPLVSRRHSPDPIFKIPMTTDERSYRFW